MDFLRQQNKVLKGDRISRQISAKGKHVIVIGGGDTGSDCVGTSNRQGAASVTQIELMPKPPISENKALTWPYRSEEHTSELQSLLRTSYAVFCLKKKTHTI